MPAIRVVLRSICGIFCFLAGNVSQAELLIYPTNGTQLWTGSLGLHGELIEDPVFPINASGAFKGKLFGAEAGPVTVSENGHLNFDGNRGFFPDALNQMPRMIAPLFDDFLFLPGADNAVIDHSVVNQYLAITWQNVRLFNETFFSPDFPADFPATQRSAQVVWFEAPTEIKGVQFQADEIVFSYVGHQPGTSDFGDLFAAVGLSAGDSAGTTRFSPLPGKDDGFITADESNLLAWEDGSYLIFRPSGDSYVVQKEFIAAVPEPSSFGLVALVMIGAGGRYWRRRYASFSKSSDEASLEDAVFSKP